MKRLIEVLLALLVFTAVCFPQNITNKLGNNGSYIVTDQSGNTILFNVKNPSGSVGVGSNAFDGTNPEKLLIDAGTTNSVNALYCKGTINNYFQMNIRNLSSGTQASSDLVCTADNGTETTYFMNMGINGSGYVYQNGNPIETGKFNDCYLLASGNDFYICDNNASKDMLFLTGGTSANNERMRIKNNGKIGIGTSNPNYLLSLSGGAYSNGNSWYNASDSTLKSDVQTLTKYGLDDLMKLRPVSYYYKSDPDRKMEIGFIAQEVKNVIPEVVFGEEGAMGITYGNLVPVLVLSIKEQQKKIDDQQREIDQIKAEVRELKAVIKSDTAGSTSGTAKLIALSLILCFIGSVLAILRKNKMRRIEITGTIKGYEE